MAWTDVPDPTKVLSSTALLYSYGVDDGRCSSAVDGLDRSVVALDSDDR